jgi:hypothetical protein
MCASWPEDTGTQELNRAGEGGIAELRGHAQRAGTKMATEVQPPKLTSQLKLPQQGAVVVMTTSRLH